MRVFFFVFFLFAATIVHAEESAWPRSFEIDGYEISAYAPELNSISGMTVTGRAAFSVTLSDTNMVFGAMSFTAEFASSASDKSILELKTFTINRLRLPEDYAKYTDTTARSMEQAFLSLEITSTFAQLQGAVSESASTGVSTTDVKNAPPEVLVVEVPSLLVFIDGKPTTKAIENSTYEYMVNSKVPIIYDPALGYYYIPNGSDWYRAQTIGGEWTPATSVPNDLEKLVEVDDSAEKDTKHNLNIVIATKPTELVAFDGKPAWKPLVDTELLTATNTESSIFKSVSTGKTYLLISGRWFQAQSVGGPWTFVEPADLPDVFAKISPDSERGSVLAAVAGTDQAEDAVLEAYIPQTATVDRASTKLQVEYDGEPWFEKVSDSSVEYAVNTTTPVLKISGVFYAVDKGVWFKSSSATGPWAVSDVRPDEVNSIPNSSSIANVKYVYVYNSTPTVVYVGYTPGYYGTYVYGPTVVYGTGWYYNPWYGPHYYPQPYTYGYHVHYSSYHGWGYGYSSGWAHVSVHYGPTWYRAPYYRYPPMHHPPAYRPGYHPGYHPEYNPGYRPPTNRPMKAQPSTRPSGGYQPSVRPNVPSGSVNHPSSRPSAKPAYTPTARPTTRPTSVPSSRPHSTPSGGGRRRS